MLLLLARHGETQWNVEKRIQGWGNSDLTEAGRAQVRRLGARLADEPISGVYTSDLPRAVETTRLILGKRDVPVTMLADLRETSWGEWEGKTAIELEAEVPELWAKFTSHGRAMNESEDASDWETSTVIPGGETLNDAAHRIASALKTIRAAHPADMEQVLVVGHGGSLRFFLTAALGLPPSRSRRFHLDNASLSTVLYVGGHPPVVKGINDVGHQMPLVGK
jgi:probable phosphoglycerate mutase